MQHSCAASLRMVRFMVCTTFYSLFLLNTSAQAQAGAGRPEPKDMDIIKSLSLDLQEVYTKFGPPTDLVPQRGSKEEEDRVLCYYGTFILCFRNEKVVHAFFRTKWNGSIMGLKIGDSRETVAKVMGAPKETYSNKDKVVTAYGYPMKDLDVTFYAAFDPETGKLNKVEIAPLAEDLFR